MKVLDHGFVELINHMGSDLTVANAARTSFGKYHTKLTKSDIELIKNLGKWGHETPFRHCQLSFKIKWPIFVARQAMRHNVGCVWSEKSLRYTKGIPEFYLPELLDEKAMDMIDYTCQRAYDQYFSLLQRGISPEIARLVLPLSTYTECVLTCSLQACAHFIKLREDKHAQKEIQEYAKIIRGISELLFPISLTALLQEAK